MGDQIILTRLIPVRISGPPVFPIPLDDGISRPAVGWNLVCCSASLLPALACAHLPSDYIILLYDSIIVLEGDSSGCELIS